MTPREVFDVVNKAAKTFQDFEWRLTSGAARTWYWWNGDDVSFNVGSHNHEPVDGLEVTCMYCPASGGVNDRVFNTQVFTRLMLDEVRKEEMQRLFTNMALDVLSRMEEDEE